MARGDSLHRSDLRCAGSPRRQFCSSVRLHDPRVTTRNASRTLRTSVVRTTCPVDDVISSDHLVASRTPEEESPMPIEREMSRGASWKEFACNLYGGDWKKKSL